MAFSSSLSFPLRAISLLAAVFCIFLVSTSLLGPSHPSSTTSDDKTTQNLAALASHLKTCPPPPACPPTAAPPPNVANVREGAFQSIYDTKAWSDGESGSGTGSTMNFTVNARRFISAALRTFNLTKLVDAPCGDCNWQWAIDEVKRGTVEYTGLDIVPSVIQSNLLKRMSFSNMRFAALDFVSMGDALAPRVPPGGGDPKPLWEIINCRDALQHLHWEDGMKAVKNFEASGAKYLVTGWYTGAVNNQKDGNMPAGAFYSIDPMLPPFNFPKPLFYSLDGWNYDKDPQQRPNMKMVGVWKLPVLGLGDGTTIKLNIDELWRLWENPKEVQILDGNTEKKAEWVKDPGPV